MEPAVRERIFEAFFTTKEVTGTGLGLWVSHEIIVKHGGSVQVRSRTAGLGKALWNRLPDIHSRRRESDGSSQAANLCCGAGMRLRAVSRSRVGSG